MLTVLFRLGEHPQILYLTHLTCICYGLTSYVIKNQFLRFLTIHIILEKIGNDIYRPEGLKTGFFSRYFTQLFCFS